ncbi:hypothetical protein [Sciscionella marina]|nr:hypothetical protein [Sciscionella marina]
MPDAELTELAAAIAVARQVLGPKTRHEIRHPHAHQQDEPVR